MEFASDQERRDFERHRQQQRSISVNSFTKPVFVASSTQVGKVHSVGDLKASRGPTEWIVEEFGARGACVLLAADKGSGKTTLLYSLADAITKGELFMGQLPTRCSKILVVQGDESRTNAVDKLEVMGIDAGFDFLFPDDAGWSGLELAKLRQLVHVNGYEVVLLDSVTTLLGNGATGRGMNESEFAAPLYALNQLAGELGILCLITSHLRKSDPQIQKSVTADDVLGAGTITAAISDIWSLSRAAKPEFPDHYILQCLGKRYCQQGTAWNLEGSQEDFSWLLRSVADPNDLLPVRRRELKEKVVELLRETGQWMLARDIAEGLGCNVEHVRRTCRELVSTQVISKKKAESTGGRPAWLYGIGTFPT